MININNIYSGLNLVPLVVLCSLVWFIFISNIYGLFNAKICIISKCLIVIITIFSITFSKKFTFLFVYNYLFVLSYMISSISIKYYNFIHNYMWPSQLGPQNTSTTSLPSGKTPPMSVVNLTLNNLVVGLQ